MAKPLYVFLLALAGFVALCIAPEARASGTVAGSPGGYVWVIGSDDYKYGSMSAACNAFFKSIDSGVSWRRPPDPVYECTPSPSNPSARGTAHVAGVVSCGPNCGNSADYAVGLYRIDGIACPAHSLVNGTGSSCTCDDGYKSNSSGTACVADCTALQDVSSGYFDIGTNQGATPQILACTGVCEVIFDGTSPAGSAIVNGQKHWYAKGTYRMTGGTCKPGIADKQIGGTSGVNGTAAKPEDSCADGQAKGIVNGKTVCVDQSGDGSKPTDQSKTQGTSSTEKTKVTNPDGSTTETETRTRVDANGNKEVTVTRTTTRPDGSQSVDRTVENPLPGTTLGGTQSGTDNNNNNEEQQKDECEKHPSSAGCGGTPAAVNSLYTAKTKTLSDVLTTARAAFMASPIGTAATNFFAVSGGGSCPTATAHIAYFNADLTFDQFCSSFATSALLALKVALLLVASFFAFRVAVE